MGTCQKLNKTSNLLLNLLTYAKQQLQKFQTKDNNILNIIAADTPYCSGFQFQFEHPVNIRHHTIQTKLHHSAAVHLTP